MNRDWLDEYEAGDVVGNGSFGVIRKVVRKADGIVLARKELNFERMSDKDRKQIVAEVNILKDLSHDHIVRYHDRFVDRDKGILYILMEYCGGGDLGSVLNKARKTNRLLPEDTIWRYFYQILLALYYCHSTGSTSDDYTSGGRKTQQILHRDIKPENVFLSEQDHVKLGDFGLSKQMGLQALTHTYVGTPYYMSPEMMSEKAYDTKSDIWSLGCLIFELCALQPPFHEAKTHSELAGFIKAGRIPPLPKGYSSSLSKVIKEMLHLNPGSRPSAQSLLSHDRFKHLRTVMETEKVLMEVRQQKEAVRLERESLQVREHSVAAREAEISVLQQRIEQERLSTMEALRLQREELRSQKEQIGPQVEAIRTQTDDINRQRELIYQQEEINKQEREANRLLRKDLESGWASLESERACFDAGAARARGDYERYGIELQNLQLAQARLAKEREEFDRERERWIMEVNTRSKKPFDDIQNQNFPPLPTLKHQPADGPAQKTQPTLSSRHHSSRSQDQNQPPADTSSNNPRHNTPPARSLPSRRASKSNPNLGSAMKGVVLTNTGTALDTPEQGGQHNIPPVPAIPGLHHLLNDPRHLEDSPEPKRLSHSETEPRARLRRRSTVSSAIRPVVQHAATAPTSIPTWNPDALPPPPVYDMADEANLPSPFIKKLTENTTNGTTGWGTIKAGLKKGPGLLGLATTNATSVAVKSSTISGGTKSHRSSVAKALKASEDATKVYDNQRRKAK